MRKVLCWLGFHPADDVHPHVKTVGFDVDGHIYLCHACNRVFWRWF